MTVFFLAATAMIVLALSLVLLPLLRNEQQKSGKRHADVQRDALNLAVLRDQLRELDADLQAGTIDAAGYQSARQELERRVIEDVAAQPLQPIAAPRQRWPVVAVALFIPLVAGGLYAMLGTPKGLDPAQQVAKAPEAAAPAMTSEQIEGMVAGLAAKLKANPNDADGWRMLARSYETMRRFDLAVDAYQHLLKLTPENADLLADYAVTLAMSRNQALSGEPERLINRALTIEPNNVQALALSGSAAFERKDYKRAVLQWKQILAIVPPDSDM
ncbi:MAG TPA: c-type cytochrome biogenesis protein CcmI, partial [Herminiimonas sp.]|nr:c-type cytochrome biogenesis protein CcmI [Herminiimonas sp.]